MLKCNACGGTYQPVQPDGTQYFHVCPPLSAPELAAKVAAGKLSLPALETADEAVARRTYERANKRDETVIAAPTRDKAGTLKTAGAGVTVVADPPAAVVVVP